MQLLKFKHMLAGNKTEYLVYKFISKLRETVASTKLQAEQRQNEKYVAKLIEKQSYNAQFGRKKAEPLTKLQKIKLKAKENKIIDTNRSNDTRRAGILKNADETLEISRELTLNQEVVPKLNLEQAADLLNSKQFGSSRSSIGAVPARSKSTSEEDSDADYE